MYLGAASGTTVSHVSDIVGPVSTFHSCSESSYDLYMIQLSSGRPINRSQFLALGRTWHCLIPRLIMPI